MASCAHSKGMHLLVVAYCKTLVELLMHLDMDWSHNDEAQSLLLI